MTHLPDWPNAYRKTLATGVSRQYDQDFKVTGIPLATPTAEETDEHIWLYIEKNGATTALLAKAFLEWAPVKPKDVGYDGMKDRHSISLGQFSIYMPRVAAPDFSQLNDDEMVVITQTRSNKKIRRGDLLGNHFEIRLRNIQGDKSLIEANLEQVKALGVPNYFGR